MKKEVIAKCPICGEELTITRLHCHNCGVEINGEFALNKLCRLSKEQLTFVLLFLKNQGNIKAIEKDMNISYPTVKKLLNDVLSNLGFDVSDEATSKTALQRQEILDKLAKKEISFDEANQQLKNLK
ncbi:MAG TPA: DUF2089 domain-containing protein [Bacilli bacterium]|nr:MAG: hypothetical protein BWY97_01237 [Tenericutes bacterium ADurb.BinA124]HNZ50727.1 DUF2089 domain-containing protein [Bacilli bacterium]HOH18368.1 DUF2089 domain-containing protein [Bacilli bacterium]HPN60911.1 DUF2089 domain-containing protein [Bacilli bacterium]HPX84843.1 DUF2089 domain-containing protein [Bacilli bacterium]